MNVRNIELLNIGNSKTQIKTPAYIYKYFPIILKNVSYTLFTSSYLHLMEIVLPNLYSKSLEGGPGRKTAAGGGGGRRTQQEAMEVGVWKEVLVERELQGGGGSRR